MLFRSGLMTFANGTMEPGFDLFAEISGLDQRIKRANLVITGEGKIDEQTYMGKGVGQVGQLCMTLGVPCISLAGMNRARSPKKPLFALIAAMEEIANLTDAQKRPRLYLRKLARRCASQVRESRLGLKFNR